MVEKALERVTLDRIRKIGRVEQVIDLTLTHESTGSMAIDGWEGETVTCSVRFKPVAGYRKGRKALDYLKNRSRMTITFAPLGTTGVYGPVRATVGTQIGTITVQAQRFKATK